MPWGLFIIAMQATAFVGVFVAFSVFCSLGGKEFFSVVTCCHIWEDGIVKFHPTKFAPGVYGNYYICQMFH